ncbi:MAG: extracellular solute-binding protein [Ruminococcaceae bacterium]|nr:extracellular solute-binding protein [Oscillospiraceae bacterium]
MNVYSKLIASVLCLSCLCGSFAACARGSSQGNGTVNNGGNATGNPISLTIWGAQEDQQMLKEMCDAYAMENPDKTYQFRFGVLGEGNSSDKILNDVEAGPDIFAFPSDRINTFYAGGALARIGGDLESQVKANNSEGSVEAATIRVNGEDHLYAFPVTGDNCYFLYYDKSVFKNPEDLQSMDRLLDVAESAGKKVHFKINDDGWYLASFFFADEDLGYDVTYNDRMVEEKVEINFDSEDGLDVMKAIRHYVNRDGFVAQTDDSKIIAAFTPDSSGKRECAAAVSGTWNAATIKRLLGDNMGVCILPTVKIDGEDVRLSGFMGYKLMGVNGYSQNKGEAAKLAAYLTNEQNQLKRFRTRGLGPTNKKVSALPEVMNDPIISTVLEQAAYNRSQKDVPSAFWTPMASLITPILTAKAEGKTVSDQQLQEYLNALCKQIRK